MQLQRCLAVVATKFPDHLAAAMKAMYKHFFVELKPIVDPDDFMPVLNAVLGPEAAFTVLNQSAEEGARLLAEQTDEAIEAGAFGLPWVDGKFFVPCASCHLRSPVCSDEFSRREGGLLWIRSSRSGPRPS